MKISPCRRGHSAARNEFGQCVVCLRESRRTYKKSHTTKQRTRVNPIAVATTTRDALPIPRSFLAVARAYISSQDDVAPSTAKKREYSLDQLSALHAMPMSELMTSTIVRALSAHRGRA